MINCLHQSVTSIMTALTITSLVACTTSKDDSSSYIKNQQGINNSSDTNTDDMSHQTDEVTSIISSKAMDTQVINSQDTTTVVDTEIQIISNNSVSNCVAIFKQNNQVISQIYLAGNLQENYFLPCHRHNGFLKLNIQNKDTYIFSVMQETPENRSFPISRVVEIENDIPEDNIYESNLLDGCFVRNPIQDINVIKELLSHKQFLDAQCNQEHGQWTFNKNITLYNDDLTKGSEKLSKKEKGYIIDSKQVNGKTWYQIGINDSDSLSKKWVQCNHLDLC